MLRSLPLALVAALVSAPLSATTYYVSSESGSDGNDGQSPATPFATVGRVNQLALQPGDVVRFFCGETWRADPLSVEESGTAVLPILFSSYPSGCANRPLLSGAQPIAGWSLHSGSVWVADLDLGANAGRFPHGSNQLFRGSERLPCGRWPDLEGHPDGGWASLDAQPASNQVADADLPAGDWTGAVAHIRGMTWYILNRAVTADSGSTLTLGHDAACFNGSCAGWGYYLSSHLATLSREGEWYWEAATNRVYLFTAAGPPAAGDVEGSAVLVDDDRYHGGVVLGRDLYEHVSHIRLENLRVERWYGSGVTTPTNLESAENDHVTLSGIEIRDVDDAGIRLTTWVWDPASGPAGWRGGSDHLLEDVVVERANHFGVDSYARLSTFRRVTVRDVGRIRYAGTSGIGCGFGPNDWDCTEAGAGVRLKRDQPGWSSTSMLLEDLVVERVGMNGIDVFGDTVTIDDTVIRSACLSKSDCGGIRSFGEAPLASSPVHDLLISDTLVSDVQATTAGCHPSYRYPLGFGLYVDHYSSNVDLERVTASACRPTGILYQDSTGDVSSSVVYDPDPGTWGGSALVVSGSGQATLSGSTLFSLDGTVTLIDVDTLSQLPASNGNSLFSPWDASSLCLGSTCYDLPGWRGATGLDLASTASWYTQTAGEPPRSQLFVNETASPAAVDLGGAAWTDLDQNPITALVLPPFGSAVLVRRLDAIFADGFESGDTGQWSRTQPETAGVAVTFTTDRWAFDNGLQRVVVSTTDGRAVARLVADTPGTAQVRASLALEVGGQQVGMGALFALDGER
jgi:hypothetical protein